MIVVDASAVIDVLLDAARQQVLVERVLAPGLELAVPELLDIEVAQVLRRFETGGVVASGRARTALGHLAGLPLRRYRHVDLLDRIWQLRGNLTANDAAYVALAEGLDVPLVTRDRRIADAPGHMARVELL